MKKTNLQKALEIVKPGLASKEMIEQSTSFAFMEGRVVTYNDEISISHPVEGLEIEGAVQAEELYKLLNKLKKDEIEITIKKSEIILKSGRTKAGLTLHEEVKLPLEEIGKMSKWKKLPENFLRHVKFAMAACSCDMSKPVLTCVHINEDVIEGSDSFRIARCQLKEEMPVKTFLIPATSAMEVIRLGPTKIAEGEGWIHFQTGEETVLSCRIFEDKFPDCTQFMKIKGVSIVFPKSLNEVLDRAEVFAHRDHFLDETITINLQDKRLKVASESESGWFEEDINFKYDGNPVTFAITPYLLKDILAETQACILGENRLKFEGEGWEYLSMLKK